MLFNPEQLKSVIKWYKNSPCYVQAMLYSLEGCKTCPCANMCSRLTVPNTHNEGANFERIVR